MNTTCMERKFKLWLVQTGREHTVPKYPIGAGVLSLYFVDLVERIFEEIKIGVLNHRKHILQFPLILTIYYSAWCV